MPEDIDIQDVPEYIVRSLELSAALNKRSLDQEILAILSAAIAKDDDDRKKVAD